MVRFYDNVFQWRRFGNVHCVDQAQLQHQRRYSTDRDCWSVVNFLFGLGNKTEKWVNGECVLCGAVECMLGWLQNLSWLCWTGKIVFFSSGSRLLDWLLDLLLDRLLHRLLVRHWRRLRIGIRLLKQSNTDKKRQGRIQVNVLDFLICLQKVCWRFADNIIQST